MLLVGHALGDGVGGCCIDLLGEVEEEVEVAVFQVALLDVFVLTNVLFQVFLRRLVSRDGWEVALFDDCELVVFGGSEGDLHEQELGLKVGHVFAADDKGREGVSWSKSDSLLLLFHSHLHFPS